MQFVRHFARYAQKNYFYWSKDEFLDSPTVQGTHSIKYGDYFLDLMLIDRGSETTLVMFHAAISPERAELPVFIGSQIAQLAEANVLFVSEPALDLGLSIGWYAGDSNRNLQKDLTHIIEHAQRSLRAKHLIFWGSSAGGFAALHYSHQIPGSLAIAVNPQTNIFRYHQDKVDEFLNTAWAGVEHEEIPATIDLVELYQGNFPNYVLYLQNELDTFHVKNHLDPWKRTLHAYEGPRWKLLMENWGEGHAAPPPELLQGLLTYATSYQGNWSKLLGRVS